MAAETLEEGVLLNISEMIDLAIGTPEIGVVDFCMLQTVLHCLAQQLRVLDKNVELRGSIAVLPVGRQSPDAQTVAVNEYLLETDGKPVQPDDQDTILIVERVQKTQRDATGSKAEMPGKIKSGKLRGKGKGSEKDDVAPGAGPGGFPGAPGAAPGAAGAAGAHGAAGAAGAPGAAGTAVAATADAAAAPGAAHGTGPAGAPGTAPGGVPGAPGGAPGTGPGGAPGTGPGGAPGTGPGGAPGSTPGTGPGATSGAPSAVSSLTSAGKPRAISSQEKLSLVTLSKFNVLEGAVEDLKNRVYGSIPKNEEILEEVRSQTNLKAITDMWTNLNVSSRLEAAEEAVAKLSSLLQDVIGETAELQKTTKALLPLATQAAKASEAASAKQKGTETPSEKSAGGAAPTEAPPATAPGAPAAAPAAAAATPPKAAVSEAPPSQQIINTDLFATRDELMQLFDILKTLREDHDWLTDAFVQAMKDMKQEIEEPPPQAPMPPTLQMSQAASTLLRQPTSGMGPSATDGGGISKYQMNLIQEKLDELEDKLKLCNDVVFTPHGTVQEQIDSLQDQLESLQRITPPLVSLDAGGGKPSPDIASDLKALMQLFQTVQNMQMQLQQVHETAVQLAAEKDDRQHNINSLLEQIELLKSIKLDREDMVEALADKADMRMLARKVSHDQFELACDDLSRGLEHALGKLNVQESLWQQALDDIQREIEMKLDKIELSPVKDFFNNKLKQLQEHLKQMAELRREAQAAGTKRRLLRDVNCISCDAKAVMAMEASPALPSKPLPPTLSMKPYLSYELDAIRKAQASSLPQRNMHDWENVTKQMTTPRLPQKVRSETDKHICNRYCGGSHTTTTPAQRVARLGHFIKQWGPEVLPLSSAYATGDDGRLYKVTAPEGTAIGPGGATDVPCTPKSPVKKEGRHTSRTPRPQSITPECRCLEERPQKN